MKTSRAKAGVFLAAVVGMGLIAWLIFRPTEPVANRKPLSFWVSQIGRPGANQTEAQAAIGKIGPQGVPLLLEEVREGESVWTRTYASIWSRLPKRVQQHVASPRVHDYGWLGQVAVALSWIEPPAVSHLAAAVEDPHLDVQLVAARAISLLGRRADAAIPTLCKVLEQGQPDLQFEAVVALEHMGPDRVQAIPALTKILDQPRLRSTPWGTTRVKEGAITTLGMMGPEAKPAVPKLTQLLEDQNPRIRQKSALALWRIMKDTRMVNRLMQELEEATDYATSAQIITALGEIGPPAKPAVPLIMEKANLRSIQTGRYALRSLKIIARRALTKIDPEAAEAMVSGKPTPTMDLRDGVLIDPSTARKLGLDAPMQSR